MADVGAYSRSVGDENVQVITQTSDQVTIRFTGTGGSEHTCNVKKTDDFEKVRATIEDALGKSSASVSDKVLEKMVTWKKQVESERGLWDKIWGLGSVKHDDLLDFIEGKRKTIKEAIATNERELISTMLPKAHSFKDLQRIHDTYVKQPENKIVLHGAVIDLKNKYINDIQECLAQLESSPENPELFRKINNLIFLLNFHEIDTSELLKETVADLKPLVSKLAEASCNKIIEKFNGLVNEVIKWSDYLPFIKAANTVYNTCVTANLVSDTSSVDLLMSQKACETVQLLSSYEEGLSSLTLDECKNLKNVLSKCATWLESFKNSPVSTMFCHQLNIITSRLKERFEIKYTPIPTSGNSTLDTQNDLNSMIKVLEAAPSIEETRTKLLHDIQESRTTLPTVFKSGTDAYRFSQFEKFHQIFINGNSFLKTNLQIDIQGRVHEFSKNLHEFASAFIDESTRILTQHEAKGFPPGYIKVFNDLIRDCDALIKESGSKDETFTHKVDEFVKKVLEKMKETHRIQEMEYSSDASLALENLIKTCEALQKPRT